MHDFYSFAKSFFGTHKFEESVKRQQSANSAPDNKNEDCNLKFLLAVISVVLANAMFVVVKCIVYACKLKHIQ